MKDENIQKIFIVFIILFIMSVGAVFGAQYADNNWKKDIFKVSHAENVTALAFEHNGITYYFSIKHLTMENYYQYLDILPQVKSSPQKHLIVGDTVVSTEEFYHYIGDTTSWGAYVIGIGNNGTIYLKIKNGVYKNFDGNNFSINEYWVNKSGHVNKSEYTGWYWK